MSPEATAQAINDGWPEERKQASPPEPKAEKSKPTPPPRDPKTIRDRNDLTKALKDDFGMTMNDGLKYLAKGSWMDVAETARECYRIISEAKAKEQSK
jgi:hypothetical protein